ncbi:MAG: chemotaxis protein CheD [Nitrospirae bacterium]|nr:chemotaxis protein CheD [Nitrospirota bacterium]
MEIPNIMSGVAVIMLDKKRGMAGAVHVLLPVCNSMSRADLTKFADTGVKLLLGEMENQGVAKHEITIKVVGGSDLMGATNFSVGHKNVEVVSRVLSQEGLLVAAQEVGGRRKRHVIIHPGTGRVQVKYLLGEPLDI